MKTKTTAARALVLALALIGCSSEGEGTGSLTFTARFPDNVRFGRAPAYSTQAYDARIVITTVRVTALQAGAAVAAKDFEAAARQGELLSLPSGSYEVTVEALVGGDIKLRGRRKGVVVETGKVADAGEFTLAPVIPAPPVLLRAPRAVTNVAELSLSGEKEMFTGISLDGAPAVAVDDKTTFSLKRVLSEGINEISLAAVNPEGTAGPALVLAVELDTKPPKAVSFEPLFAFVKGTASFSLQAEGATEMMVGLDANFTKGFWVPYEPTLDLTLTGPDRVVTLFVRFRDDAGNTSEVLSASVVYDTAPPSGAGIDVVGSPSAVSTETVNVVLTAVDAAEMQLSVGDSGFTSALWQGFTTTSTVALGTIESTYVIYARFRDLAGNVSPVVSASVIRDISGPTITAFSVVGGPAVVNTGSVDLEVRGQDLWWIQVSEDLTFVGAAWQAANSATLATLPFTLSPGDGVKRIYARFRDYLGNTSGSSFVNVLLDTTAPNFTAFSINGGATAVSSATVTLDIAATGADEMMLSEDPGFTAGVWEVYSASKPYTLSGPEGAYTLYVKTRDVAGNESSVMSASVVLDMTPPELPTVAFAGSPAALNTTGATLALSAIGAVDVQVSEDPGFAGAVWQPMTASLLFWLSPGDGMKTVYAQYRDSVGNLSTPVSASVQLDMLPPESASVTINAGAAYATSPGVTLAFAAIGATELRYDYNPGFTMATWVPFTTTTGFTFPAGDGAKTIYVEYRDAAGNVAATSASTILDTLPPELNSFLIDGGATAVSGATVTLDITATGADEMMLSEDPGFTAGVWEVYSASKPYTLSGPEGAYTLYVKARDLAGNVSGVMSAAVTLDLTPPELLSFSPVVAYTNTSTAFFDLMASDNMGAPSLQISEDPAFGGATWEPASTQASLMLTAIEGPHLVYLRLKDDAGNLTSSYSATVTYDVTGPVVSVFQLVGAPTEVNINTVSVEFSVSDMSPYEVALSEDPTFTSALFAPLASPADFTLSIGDGAKTVNGRFRDLAGNLSDASVPVVLDTLAPELPTVAFAGSPAALNTTGATLALSAIGAVDVQVSEDPGLAGAVWQPMTASLLFWLSPGDGMKTVYAQYRDSAGNLSTPVSASVQLDMLPPESVSVTINAGAAYATSPGVTLAFAAIGATELRYDYDPGFTMASWVPFTTTTGFTFPAGDGTKTIYVEYRDAAGNVAATNASTILDSMPPELTSFLIDGGATAVSGATVTLDITATGADEMMLSEDPGFTAGVWEAYSASKPYTLSGPEGAYTLYVKARDIAGNVSGVMSAAVTLDLTPPSLPTVSIVGSPSAVSSQSITLALGAVEANDVQVSEDPAFSGAPWQPISASVPFTLSAGDGMKTIYARYRDAVDNRSAPVSTSVMLDTMPPGFTAFSINGGAGAVSTTMLLLSLSAATDATEMVLSEDPAFGGAAWQAYASGTTFALSSAVDGSYTIYAKVRDGAGNESAPLFDSVLLDTTLPSAEIVSPAPGALNAWTLIQGTASDSGSGATAVDVSLRDAGTSFYWDGLGFVAPARVWLSANLVAGAWSWVVPAIADGVYHVEWRVFDAANNSVMSASPSAYTLDTQPPIGASVLINSGEATIASPSVTLYFSVTGATEMRYDYNASFTMATWGPVVASAPFTFPGGDGAKTIYVEYRDAAGNIAPASATTTLSSSVPQLLSFIVEGGATAVSNATVSIALSATNATEMMIADNAVFTGGVWVPYATSTSYTIAGPENYYTLYAKVRDAVLNESASMSASIALDYTPPSLMSFAPAVGMEYVNTTNAWFDLTASDNMGAPYVQVSEDPGFAGAVWELASTQASLMLDPIEGAHIVYLRLRDDAHNMTVTTYSATVTYDATMPTVSLVGLQGGATVANSATVTLDLSAGDASPLEMAISEDQFFTSPAWQAYVTAPTFAVSPGDGPKIVYVRFRDAAGNFADGWVSFSLDSAAPVVTMFRFLGEPVHVNYTSVTVESVVTDAGVIEMQISEDPAFAAATWTPYSSSYPYSLTGGEGVRNVYGRFKDDAGHVSGAQVTSVTLDQTAPSVAGVPVPAVNPVAGAVSLSWTAATDALSGVKEYSLEVSSGAGWSLVGFVASTSHSYPAADGVYTFRVAAWDNAGNPGPFSAVSVPITVDTLAPTSPSVEVAGNPSFVASPSVTLNLAAVGATEMQISEDPSFVVAVWQPFASTIGFALNATDGAKFIYARFRDGAGNVSMTASTSVTLDQIAPVLSSTTVASGAAFTNSAWVLLDTVASGDAYEMKITGDAVTAGWQWQPYAASTTVPLATHKGATVNDFGSSSGDRLFGVAQQNDGKIVVVGAAFNGTDDDILVARYTNDGAIDATFGTGGKVLIDNAAMNDLGRAVALQSDGKIVVVGSFAQATQNDFAVVRLNSDGSLDTSFNIDGKAPTPIGASNDDATAVAIQSDGKIVVVGSTWTGTQYDFAVARFDSVGNLDTTFNTTGIVTVDISTANDVASGVVIQADGNIVIGGSAATGTNARFALVRLTTVGAIDTSYGTGGTAETEFSASNDEINGLAIQDDGYVVAVGSAWNGADYDFAVARYDTSGALDTGFASGGKTVISVGPGHDYAFAVGIQSSGGIVIAGTASDGLSDQLATLRIDTYGLLDFSFGTDGMVVDDASTGVDRIRALAIESGGFILAAGYVTPFGTDDSFLAMYDEDGSPYGLFGPLNEGLKNLYVRVRDAAGNESQPLGGSITYDVTPPQSPIVGIQGAPAIVGDPNVTLTFSAIGASQLRYDWDPAFTFGSWLPFTASTGFTFPPGDGVRYVYAQFSDEAGNFSAVVSASTILDTTPPDSTFVNVTGSPAEVSSTSISLDLGANAAYEYQVSEDAGFTSATWEIYISSIVFNLSVGDGVKTIYARYRDLVGNMSAPVSTSVILRTKKIESLSVTSGMAGDSVVLSGYGFGSVQGVGYVSVGAVTAPVTSWSATAIGIIVPGEAGPGPKDMLVMVDGLAATNALSFTVKPQIDVVSISSGSGGDPITLTGTNFGDTQGTSWVNIGGQAAQVSAWSMNTITVLISPMWDPYSYGVMVSSDGGSSNVQPLTVYPRIDTVTPAGTLAGGDMFTIQGANLGSDPFLNDVAIGGVPAPPVSAFNWYTDTITAEVPAEAAAGITDVIVTVNGFMSNSHMVTIVPKITSVTPVTGSAGTVVTIAGTGFGATQGASMVVLGPYGFVPDSWSSTSITVSLDAMVGGGNHTLSLVVNSQPSNGMAFTIKPVITAITPGIAPAGTGIAVSGTNFGSPGTGTVSVGGLEGPVWSWNETAISTDVHLLSGPGLRDVVVTAGGVASAAVTVEVTVPSRVAFTTTSQTVMAGACSPTGAQVELQDTYGNPSPATPGNVMVTLSGADLTFYEDAGCVTVAGSVEVPAGSPAAPAFYFSSTVAGSPTIVASAAGLTGASQAQTIDAGAPVRLVFTAAPASVAPSTCSSVLTVESQDAYGNTSAVASNTTVSLATTSGAGSFYSDASCAVLVSSAAIVMGNSSVSLYYMDNTEGSPTIDAIAAGLVGASHVMTVGTPAPLLDSLVPLAGRPGTEVTLTGSNFGTSPVGDSAVYIDGHNAMFFSWSETTIIAYVPTDANPGEVKVKVRVTGKDSNDLSFEHRRPWIDERYPASGTVGTSVTLVGRYFGSVTGLSRVGGIDGFIEGWTDTTVQLRIEPGTSNGTVRISLDTPDGFSTNSVPYVQRGSDVWLPMGDAPAARHGHTAVWTGTEMIVWGGNAGAGSDWLRSGARYNPATDSWLPTPLGFPAPVARSLHSAVWTGKEMIVWGGANMSDLGDGARYNPATDSWQSLSTLSAPGARVKHTAVWSGVEMLVWGGSASGTGTNTGGHYDPTTDLWSPVSTIGLPAGRYDHTAVWTGNSMIVWGGYGGGYRNDGGIYDPIAYTWNPVTTTGAPAIRAEHTAVWTGTEMAVWGGFDGTRLSTGGLFDPKTNAWRMMSATSAPVGRSLHAAAWDGDAMLVWGGMSNSSLSDGAAYYPASDTWATLSTSPLLGVYEHTAVYTGKQLIVWGGTYDGTLATNDGAVYDSATGAWVLTSKNFSEPSARIGQSAVWTGAEMIVWGGADGISFFNDGAKYNPANDTWTPTSTLNAPPGRNAHSAVWSGSEMIVWGGAGSGGVVLTGGMGSSYDPATDMWTTLATASEAKKQHAALMLGGKMLVSGGVDQAGIYTKTCSTYDPLTTMWAATGVLFEPRAEHTIVSIGTDAIVFGGNGGGAYLATGERYAEASGTWTSIAAGPAARSYHSAATAAGKMIVWGGYSGSVLNNGSMYDWATDVWTPMTLTGAPAARQKHVGVSVGADRVFIFGGVDLVGPVAGAVVFTPSTNTWGPVSGLGMPLSRSEAAAVFTGEEVIIWGGGDTPFTLLGSGARYMP